MHTGYSETEFNEKRKAERNVELLRKELEEKPNDMMINAYLADSLNSINGSNNYSNDEDVAEVDAIFNEVINTDEKIPDYLKKKAYEHVLKKIWNDKEKKRECVELCEKAINDLPENLDFYYHCSVMLNEMGEYNRAWDLLHDLDSKIVAASNNSANTSDGTASTSFAIATDPMGIYGQTLIAAQGMNDVENTLKYAEKILKKDKTLNSILSPYILTLHKIGLPPDEIMEKLAEIYDITSPNDLLFIARSAKDCGAVEFAKLIMVIAGEILNNQN